MNALKDILRNAMYAGAIVCCLPGLLAIPVIISNFREPAPDWPRDLAVDIISICLSFAPAIMLLMGLKNRIWHWVFIGIVEATVIGFFVYLTFFTYARA
jgi:hypothetical protein